MGERIRKLTIEAFRGVPGRWEIAWPRGESMVIWGPNGTGKSTVADALEWFYGGRIDFLAREGRDRSLRNQAARREVQTRVTVETDGGHGGAQLAPLRSSTGPWAQRRLPDNIVLRGRTLSDFVEKPKADKFRTLATILGLQDVDRLRLDLQTDRNQLDEASIERRSELHVTTSILSSGGVVDEAHLVTAISERCFRAGIPAPASLPEALAPGWLTSRLGSDVQPNVVAVAGLSADIDADLARQHPVADAEAWNSYLTASTLDDPLRLRFVQAANAFVAARCLLDTRTERH